MASLNKLAIRGIRSFDDKTISVIEFFNPVTVIVGHNGSGKTTIIECLKYATTGDHPPNTRGGAFIHDPKMANEKEVKAQVKLRFNAANGTKMLAVRNLSVTAKKTTGLTMKTLESILALADENSTRAGKRAVISTKCAEMDAEIPQLLGVSKSVLENVIFCHQEDSWWPLAEPAALKKKFDDIFEATRYTKALDNIKALRKDRLAELKAEKERLEGLAREKSHADKLRTRINDLSSDIAKKEIEHEEVKAEYEKMVNSNRQFQEYAIHFREIYLKVENLEVRKATLQKDLDEARMNMKELPGGKDALEAQLASFDERMNKQNARRKTRNDDLQDVQDELNASNKQHMELVEERAAHTHDAANQKERIAARSAKMRDIAEQHGFKGYTQVSQDRDQVLRFVNELETMLRSNKASVEKIKAERQSRQDDYNVKLRELTQEFAKQQSACKTLREQMDERNKSIQHAEREIDRLISAPGDLSTLQDEMEEKKRRANKAKDEYDNAKYDEKIATLNDKKRMAENRRDDLTAELKSLNSQVELHARLSYKKKDLEGKTKETTTALDAVNKKLKSVGAKGVKPAALEREVPDLIKQKEDELAQREKQGVDAKVELQKLKSTLESLEKQVTAYRTEAKGIKASVDDVMEDDTQTVEEALDHATREIEVAKAKLAKSSSNVLEGLLAQGLEDEVCPTCTRAMNSADLKTFKQHLEREIKEMSSAKLKHDVEHWTEELAAIQPLVAPSIHYNKLTNSDIPKLEKEIADLNVNISQAAQDAEEATERLQGARKQVEKLSGLREDAKLYDKSQREVEKLQTEISSLEREVSASGSTKSLDEVQNEIDDVSREIQGYEKETRTLSAEKERASNLQRGFDKDIHDLQLQERDLQNKVKEKVTLEQQVEKWRKDIEDSKKALKVAEAHVAKAQGPIDALDSDFKDNDSELQKQEHDAESRLQEVRISTDHFKMANKEIERYVRDRREDRMRECNEKLVEQEAKTKGLVEREKQLRKDIEIIDKEISESALSQKNLQDNIRALRLAQQIKDVQAEIEGNDMEKAAKAKREFKEKWPVFKEKEDTLHQQYSHLAGEMSSKKSQLEMLESDLKKDFKDIGKRYTDQLIRTKMSDMANNDLEKYAKALDNAIMKYHGLKMEEVNDTMRHLWNKTYQGTDIDGIKIRSDAEGGASKRSYNYRVVMTKDQVEMDMRGRCSAGQKMLASIIIRLALSDSFGQNCGILALDEPTNALDTENIDALASSLVDIINERKNHANFQLIIITHDENFLRKLGQSDVMEYYWRVSRDARQKSVIERQRFR